MKVLSLFDGMSCGQIALQKAGFKVEKYQAADLPKKELVIVNYPPRPII